LEAQETATNIRKKENAAFKKSKNDLSESIASLKQAAQVLGGVAEKKEESFLAVSSRRSASSSVRRVLQQTSFLSRASEESQQLLQSFLNLASEGPSDSTEYTGQTGQVANVIGQSEKDFEADLKEAIADEGNSKETYDKLMATSKTELEDLKKNLQDLESNNAGEIKTLSDNKMLKTDNEDELEANTKLLKETTLGCQVKKEQFETRKKLREDEVAGIDQALAILTSEDATKTFGDSASVSFLQIASSDNRRKRAYEALKSVASRYHAASLALIAVEVQTIDAFKDITDKIEKQIDMLKAEEAQDVKHRDDCQKQIAENKADFETLSDDIDKKTTFLERLNEKKTELQAKSTQLEKDMNATKDEMLERGEKRTQQHDATVKALKDDKAALALLEKATASIKEFSRKNKVDMSLAAEGKPEQKTTSKHQKAPDAGFESAGYEGQKSASKGLMGLMEMVTDDVKDEIKKGEEDDASDQAQYEEDQKVLNAIFSKKEGLKISTDKILGETDDKISDLEGDKDDATSEKESTEKAGTSLETNCAWVKTNFKSRREKRKSEIDGLIEAKGILAGAAA